jgi:gold/copper resistance efflux pump
MDKAFGWLFRPFNRLFEQSSRGYVRAARSMIRRSALVGVVFAGLVGLTAAGLVRTPGGFVPAQDKYYLVGIVQLPSGASLD